MDLRAGGVLSPQGGVLLRAVVRCSCQSLAVAMLFVSPPRAHAPLPASPNCPLNSAMKSQLHTKMVTNLVVVVVVVSRTLCMTCVCVHTRQRACIQLKRTGGSAPSAGLTSRTSPSLFSTEAGSRHSRRKTSPNPRRRQSFPSSRGWMPNMTWG